MWDVPMSTNINVTTVLFPESLEKAIPIRSIVQYCCEYCPLICPCCTCHSHTRVTVSTENWKDVRITSTIWLPFYHNSSTRYTYTHICISIYLYLYLYIYILIRYMRRKGRRALLQPLYRFFYTVARLSNAEW